MSFDIKIEKLKEFFNKTHNSLSDTQKQKEFITKFKDDLLEIDGNELKLYQKANICSDRAVYKEMLDWAANLKRNILLREKSNYSDYVLADITNFKALSYHLERKQEELTK